MSVPGATTSSAGRALTAEQVAAVRLVVMDELGELGLLRTDTDFRELLFARKAGCNAEADIAHYGRRVARSLASRQDEAGATRPMVASRPPWHARVFARLFR